MQDAMADPTDGRRQIEARYANYFRVGYTAFEFVLDFGQRYSDDEDADEYHTRIVTSPEYASSLIHLLQDSLDRYWMSFGQ
jgi:Protein of unknown function (DUF3467)